MRVRKCLMILILAWAFVDAAAQMPSTPGATYRDPQHGFTLTVPNGWTVQPLYPDAVTFVRGHAALTIYIDGFGPSRRVHSASDIAKATWGNFRLLQTGECTLGNRQGFCFLYAGVPLLGKNTVLARETQVTIGQHDYSIVESAPLAELGSLNNDLEVMKQSFSPADATGSSGNWMATLAPATTASFQTVTAQDNTFSLRLPSDWQVRAATLEDFLAWSPRGESVSSGQVVVFTNALVMRSTIRTLAQAGVPPEQLASMSRMVSPPLAPADVIRVLMPRLGAHIQNVRVLGSIPASGAGSAALVLYQYLLVPAQADPAAHSRLAPALAGLHVVPMKGVAFIRVAADYGAPTWLVGYNAAEAPAPIFERNWRVYQQISQSVRINQYAVSQKQPMGSAGTLLDPERLRRIREGTAKIWQEDPKTAESNEGVWYSLGTGVGYKDPSDPSWRGQVPFSQLPGGTQRVWHCPGQSAPVFSENQPDYTCRQAQQIGQ